MTSFDIRYDGGNWNTLFNNQSKPETGWIAPPFTTLGHHTIEIKWWDDLGYYYFRDYDIYIVPTSQKLYRDGYGNTISCWISTTNNRSPIIISEGFDAYNNTFSEFLTYVGNDFFDILLKAGHSIYLVNYKYNSQDIENTAAIYHSALEYISSLHSNSNVLAGGISMGGVVARYALAKAEGNGNPLPADKLVSIDSPQQGAIVSASLQSYMESKWDDGDITNFAVHGLNNTAAYQLLYANVFNSEHIQFYQEINSLNNNTGYPQNTKNIAVSFSNGQPNVNSGKWLNLKYTGVAGINFIAGFDKDFYLSPDEKIAGSYLPKSIIDLESKNIVFGNFNATRYSDPTFIPYISALDLDQGISPFDVLITSGSNNYHDELPDDVIDKLLFELGIVGRDFTLDYNVTLDESMLVFNNSTLTINSGVNIKMKNGVDIVVEAGAKIDATGTATAPIVFERYNSTESWGEIELQGDNNYFSYCTFDGGTYNINVQSSNNTIKNSTFKNADVGLFSQSANPGTFSYSNFFNNNIGIQLASSSPFLSHNNITNNADDGIHMASSSPILSHNLVSDNGGHGLYVTLNSSPQFDAIDGHNIITNNSGIGIYSMYSIFNEETSSGQCMVCHSAGSQNSIYNNNASSCNECHSGTPEYQVSANYNSDVIVESNWWGTPTPLSSSFYEDNSSFIDYQPYLSSDPNQGGLSKIQSNFVYSTSNTEKFNHSQLSDVSLARYYQASGQYENAIEEYKKIISLKSDSKVIRFSLNALVSCSKKLKKKDVETYLDGIVDDKSENELINQTLLLKSSLLVEAGKYKEAISLNKKIVKQFSKNKSFKRDALYNMYMIYYNNLNDKKNASRIYSEMEKLYYDENLCLGDGYLKQMAKTLGKQAPSMISSKSFQESKEANSNKDGVLNNYPNPFNPSTKIEFSISKAGLFSLKVYDILGQEIYTLVQKHFESGKYSVDFNASDLTSGIYFYKLVGENVNITKKMLLMR